MADLVFPAVATVAGLTFFFLALHFWRHARTLRTHGVTAQAQVLKKFRKGTGLENYYAQLSFGDHIGRDRQVELKVRSKAWHMLREGGGAQITYLPQHPEVVRLGPKWGIQLLGWVQLFFAMVGGAMAVAGAADLMQQGFHSSY